MSEVTSAGAAIKIAKEIMKESGYENAKITNAEYDEDEEVWVVDAENDEKTIQVTIDAENAEVTDFKAD